jgi:sodium/bile acid cotransporter 7
VVMFCGSQKTLAAGIPMAQLIFAGHLGMGLILLPIMIYHPLQLILCSGLASRWARRSG